jgi:catechol 2,3-dioxygenase-like lactoylglutathione lyase family enzyme
MTIKRLDHVGVVVDDLAAAVAFFTTLGRTLEGEMPVEGPWVDRVKTRLWSIRTGTRLHLRRRGPCVDGQARFPTVRHRNYYVGGAFSSYSEANR